MCSLRLYVFFFVPFLAIIARQLTKIHAPHTAPVSANAAVSEVTFPRLTPARPLPTSRSARHLPEAECVFRCARDAGRVERPRSSLKATQFASPKSTRANDSQPLQSVHQATSRKSRTASLRQEGRRRASYRLCTPRIQEKRTSPAP